MSTKEKFTGIWKETGASVSFTREWGGYRFSDSECQALLDGEEIEILGLKSKTGKDYGIKGKLDWQTFTNPEGKEIKYVGFNRTGFADFKVVPNVWAGHEFTEDEKVLLNAGKSVAISGCKSKKGKEFAATVRWGETDQGSMGIIVEHFD